MAFISQHKSIKHLSWKKMATTQTNKNNDSPIRQAQIDDINCLLLSNQQDSSLGVEDLRWIVKVATKKC